MCQNSRAVMGSLSGLTEALNAETMSSQHRSHHPGQPEQVQQLKRDGSTAKASKHSSQLAGL